MDNFGQNIYSAPYGQFGQDPQLTQQNYQVIPDAFGADAVPSIPIVPSGQYEQVSHQAWLDAPAATPDAGTDNAASNDVISSTEPEPDFGVETVGGYGYEYADEFDPSNPYGYAGFTYGYEMPAAQVPLTTEEQLAEFIQDHANTRAQAHPLLVLLLLIVCFPAGLITMYTSTRWGAYPKILITIFVLTIVMLVYEILVSKNVLALPSLVTLVSDAWAELVG